MTYPKSIRKIADTLNGLPDKTQVSIALVSNSEVMALPCWLTERVIALLYFYQYIAKTVHGIDLPAGKRITDGILCLNF
jgi:hypothetical protein